MVASSPSRKPRRVARWAAACRVLAITLAVLSIGGRSLAWHAVATSTTAIAASSAEWRALAAAHGVVERTADAAWPDGDARLPAGVLHEVASWELGPAALARIIAWAPASTELPVEGRVIACLARGPPSAALS